MSTKQKTILIIFLVIDLLIVTALADTIIKNWSLYQITPYQTLMSDCAVDYLKVLQDNNHQITFAMDDGVVYITAFSQSIDVEKGMDEPQILWTLLDNLRTVTEQTTDICLSPKTMILQMNINRKGVTASYQATISMPDLIAWSQGTMSENNFASSIKYRQWIVSSEEINELEQ